VGDDGDVANTQNVVLNVAEKGKPLTTKAELQAAA
jgi:hypothetical protein